MRQEPISRSTSRSISDDTSVYLQYKKSTDSTWTSTPDKTATSGVRSVTFELSGLDELASYNARASLDDSFPTDSTETLDFTLPGLPEAPVITATGGDRSVAVSWTPPDDGGAIIRFYAVQWRLPFPDDVTCDGGDVWAAPTDPAAGNCTVGNGLARVSGTEYTITNIRLRGNPNAQLTNGTKLKIIVSAYNIIGYGPDSELTSAIPTAGPAAIGAITISDVKSSSATVTAGVTNSIETTVHMRYKISTDPEMDERGKQGNDVR